jgi:hypothetical protein
MRFAAQGPDIPADLLEARDRGEVVFFCGAGVSMPAGLPSFQRPWLACDLALADDPALGVNDTDARAFQRHVDPGVVFHGRLSVMLGAGSKPDAVDDAISLRDDRPTSTGSGETARYAIFLG